MVSKCYKIIPSSFWIGKFVVHIILWSLYVSNFSGINPLFSWIRNLVIPCRSSQPLWHVPLHTWQNFPWLKENKEGEKLTSYHCEQCYSQRAAWCNDAASEWGAVDVQARSLSNDPDWYLLIFSVHPCMCSFMYVWLCQLSGDAYEVSMDVWVVNANWGLFGEKSHVPVPKCTSFFFIIILISFQFSSWG